MQTLKTASLGLIAALFTASCVTTPVAPSIPVMPGPYKPFEAFQRDQAICEQYASQQVEGGAERANDRAVASGVLGTALGALIGAAAGGRRSTGFGAAAGAAVGTTIGAGSSEQAQYSLQQLYNIAYAQCMYSKGNQVPGYSGTGVAPPPPPLVR